jgi:LysR family transcriptional regulator, nitrogen assimilation regulatory protein
MDVKELRYFRAIVQCGTMCKAAAHLRIAQPALTRQIQKLEHDLGVQLLRRSTRGVTPTPAGISLLNRVTRLEAEMDDIRREVSEFSEGAKGMLHIALQYPLSTILVPQLMVESTKVFPEVRLHIVENVSRNITDGLLGEQLDIAIVDSPSHEHADLTVIPLWVEDMYLLGPANARKSDLFRKSAASIEEIAQLPIIMPTPNHALRRLVDTAFTRHKMRFQPAMEIDGMLTICSLVENGMGYTLIPRGAFYELEGAGRVASMKIKPAIRRTVSIVTRTALLQDRKTAGIIEIIKQLAPGIAAMPIFGPAKIHQDIRDGHPVPLRLVGT